MGGEGSKELPNDDDTLDNTFVSQASGGKMNATMLSQPGDGKSNRSGGVATKKGTTFLGLKTNTTQFVDTSISQYEDKALDAILAQFNDQLQRDKERNYKEGIALDFVTNCAEGF